jgi:hypothetical protein
MALVECSSTYQWNRRWVVTVRPVLDRIPHFAELLSTTQDQDFRDLRLAEGSGRPLGTAEFVSGLERFAWETPHTSRSRTQTRGQRLGRTTGAAAIGIMSPHSPVAAFSRRILAVRKTKAEES